MFESFNWAPVLFWIVVVVLIIAFWTFRSAAVLLLALVGYLGINWNMWFWVPWAFWIAWFIGLIALVLHYATRHRYTVYASYTAPWGARVALGIVVVMAVLSILAHWGISLNGITHGWWWLFWLLVLVAFLAIVFGLARELRVLAGIAFVALLVLALVGASVSLFGGNHNNNEAGPKPAPTVTTTVTAPPTTTTTTPKPTATAACPDTWQLKSADHNHNRWFADGVASIKNAKTPAQARAAANDWVHKVEYDPVLLKGAISYFLNEDMLPSALVDGKCASDLAKQKAAELELKIATSKITSDNAPANGTNSGVDNGRVVSATSSGITGDSKAIKVENADGTVVWVMWRCGNAVKKGKAPVPPGHTEHQPRPPVVHHTPPPTRAGCIPSEMPHRAGYRVTSRCEYVKLTQSQNCMLNGIGCAVPNHAVQPPQHNPGQPVGTTTGAPASPPPPAPSSTTAPGGSSGTSTGTPTGTPTCVAANGCGTTHTDPPPTGIG